MTTKTTAAILILSASLTLVGCETMSSAATNPDTAKTRRGAAIGAGVGAVVGLLSKGDTVQNAMIGAAIGGLAGGAIGNYQDRQERKLRAQLAGTGVDVQRIGDNIPLTFSTVGATTDGPSEPNLGFCCDDQQIGSDVWFIFQATHTGTATASLCGSNYDTKVAIYTGTTCPVGPNTALAGNDDSTACGGNGLQSRVTFPCTAGNQYLIRVGGYLGRQGNVQMTVASAPAPDCPADFNMDGGIDGSDVEAFFERWENGC